MAIEEAKLEDVGSGLAPVSPGWFVVNLSDARWQRGSVAGTTSAIRSPSRSTAWPSRMPPSVSTRPLTSAIGIRPFP